MYRAAKADAGGADGSLRRHHPRFEAFLESALARVLIIVRTRDSIPPFDANSRKRAWISVTRRWEDDLQQALLDHGEERHGALPALSARLPGQLSRRLTSPAWRY